MPVTEGGGRREASYLEHMSLLLAMAATAGAGIVSILALWVPPLGKLGFVTGPVFTISFFLLLSHDRKLCIHCIRESPADGVVAAQRKRRWLWTYHKVATNKKVNSVALVGYVAAFVGGAIFGQALVTAAGLIVALLLIVNYASEWIHRRLVVWCPWCKGGGREEKAPEPVPSPTLTKSN